MNLLEKFLGEIKEKCVELSKNHWGDDERHLIAKGIQAMYIQTEKIIRSHMKDVTTTNDGWIPVEEGLPEENKRVLVTVKHSGWIADFYSNWVPEEEKIKHPETSGTYIGCIHENSVWTFVDEEGQDNICDTEFGQNLGRVYNVVTHWRPIPEPYKPKKLQTEEKPVQ